MKTVAELDAEMEASQILREHAPQLASALYAIIGAYYSNHSETLRAAIECGEEVIAETGL
jgi:hypothetical protein